MNSNDIRLRKKSSLRAKRGNPASIEHKLDCHVALLLAMTIFFLTECHWHDKAQSLAKKPFPIIQISNISNSSFVAPHSGHCQAGGTSSQRVPGAMPSSGQPFSSS